MQKHHTIVIAGAGGIAEAAGLLLAEWSSATPKIFIGDRFLSKAEHVARWIAEGTAKQVKATPFLLPETGATEEMKAIFAQADLVLDCLPGVQAPRIAQYAKDFQLHYVNLTECVAETNDIIGSVRDAKTGFVLQSGIAPGYINILAHGMFRKFCEDFGVEKVDKLEFKVGALTDHAIAPHFYGFTWSTVGVATEYVRNAVVVRNFIKTTLPALSEPGKLIIDGIAYEDDLTSGGAADLPDALAGKVQSLDYKTLRYPGHYDWVKQQLAALGNLQDLVAALQQKMEEVIPHIEDDRIVLYAAVQGRDADKILRRREVTKLIKPMKIGRHTLRAIQTTTAAPMLQAAADLLEKPQKGVILQSQIEPGRFLRGKFVSAVYGEVNLSGEPKAKG